MQFGTADSSLTDPLAVEIGGRLPELDGLICFLRLNRVPKMVDII